MRHDLRALSKRHGQGDQLAQLVTADCRIQKLAKVVAVEHALFILGETVDLETLVEAADALKVEAERLRVAAVIFKQLSREGEMSTAAHAEASGETKDAEPSRDDLAGGEVPREAGAPPAKTSRAFMGGDIEILEAHESRKGGGA